jgi:hypothetical protein
MLSVSLCTKVASTVTEKLMNLCFESPIFSNLIFRGEHGGDADGFFLSTDALVTRLARLALPCYKLVPETQISKMKAKRFSPEGSHT